MKTVILPRSPLGNKNQKWRQNDFILSVFSPTDTFYKSDDDTLRRAALSVKTCADAGFNLLETGWATQEHLRAVLPACEECGIDMIYQDLAVCGGMQDRYLKDIDASVIDGVIEKTKKYKHCVGYYVWDEPYLPHQIKEAARQMAMYRERVPEKLLFTVAIPSYNNECTWQNGKFKEYLRNFVDTLQPPVLSLDYYPIGLKESGIKATTERTLMWCDLAMMRKVSRENNMPMWFYYQGQDVWKSGELTFDEVRLFMNAGALYGAKGLQHYTAVGAVVDEKTGDRGIYFDKQKEIHKKFKALGNTLMALDCVRVIHDDSLLSDSPYKDGLFDSVAESDIFTELPQKVSASEHEDGHGNKFVMVLSRDCENERQLALKLKKNFRIYFVSDEDGKQELVNNGADVLNVSLVPGGMKLFRLQNTGEEPFLIEYALKERYEQ